MAIFARAPWFAPSRAAVIFSAVALSVLARVATFSASMAL